MALIGCPSCGAGVSDHAPACIRCGHPIAQAPRAASSGCSGALAVGAALVAVMLLGCCLTAPFVVRIFGPVAQNSPRRDEAPKQRDQVSGVITSFVMRDGAHSACVQRADETFVFVHFMWNRDYSDSLKVGQFITVEGDLKRVPGLGVMRLDDAQLTGSVK